MRRNKRAPSASISLTGIADLPTLPSHVRYIDEYDDSVRTISRLSEADVWVVKYDTHTDRLDLSVFGKGVLRHAIKWFIVWSLREFSPATVGKSFNDARNLHRNNEDGWLEKLFAIPPSGWTSEWNVRLRKLLRFGEVRFVSKRQPIPTFHGFDVTCDTIGPEQNVGMGENGRGVIRGA